MGIDRAEIRRLNMIDASQYPYQTPVIIKYDSGDPKACLAKALDVADWAGFAARKAESASRGKLRGIGLCTYVEACGLAPSRIVQSLGARAGIFESATVRVHATGDVTVLIGTHNHGQGHETTFAQIVSEQLGIPADKVEIVFGDTDKVQFGLGTYGSRSLAVGGTALAKATEKVILKGKKIAAHMLEASDERHRLREGQSSPSPAPTGGSRSATWSGPPTGWSTSPSTSSSRAWRSRRSTIRSTSPIPAAPIIAEVEIDPDTGVVDLVSYVAVDDIGTVINPMIVAGQLHGGIAQGVGQALFENCVYDDDSGQMLSGSFMDYAMPRADNLPNMKIVTHSTLCTHTSFGVKGCGEVGTIGSPATVINAVVDALAHLGVTPRRHAGHAEPHLADHQQQRQPAEGGGVGGATMRTFDYHRPASTADAVAPPRQHRREPAALRRHDAAADDEDAARHSPPRWSTSPRSPASPASPSAAAPSPSAP